MKSKKVFLTNIFGILMIAFLIGCGTSATPTISIPTFTNTAIPSSTLIPTQTPTTTPTLTSTPTPYIPSEVTVEFGEGVSEMDRARILSGIGKSLAWFEKNGFGEPGETLIYADSNRETLIDKSYEIKSRMFPEETKEDFSRTWGPGTGAISMIIDGKGYIFFNLSYQYWSRPLWSGSPVTIGYENGPAHELLHILHQRLSGINFMNNGTLPRSPTEAGPDWLKEGLAGIITAYVFDVPLDVLEVNLRRNLDLVPRDFRITDMVLAQDSSDELGYLTQYGAYLLIEESPGGKKEGAKSMAIFFRALTDESKTWEEVFTETWGWTLEEFYQELEARR